MQISIREGRELETGNAQRIKTKTEKYNVHNISRAQKQYEI